MGIFQIINFTFEIVGHESPQHGSAEEFIAERDLPSERQLAKFPPVAMDFHISTEFMTITNGQADSRRRPACGTRI